MNTSESKTRWLQEWANTRRRGRNAFLLRFTARFFVVGLLMALLAGFGVFGHASLSLAFTFAIIFPVTGVVVAMVLWARNEDEFRRHETRGDTNVA